MGRTYVDRPFIFRVRSLISTDSSSKCTVHLASLKSPALGHALFLFFISSSCSPCVFSLTLHVPPILPVYRLSFSGYKKKEKFMKSFHRRYTAFKVKWGWALSGTTRLLYPCRALLRTVNDGVFEESGA